MSYRFRVPVLVALASALFGIAHAACGGGNGSEFGDGGTVVDGDASSPPGFGEGGHGDAQGCQNLECKQVACDDGGTTSVTGTVFDPAGVNPLYNALVYIPNGAVAPFDDDAGVTCDRCNGAFASGSPLVSAISGTDGTFRLDNVPVGVDLPLVIQIGKWRRMVKIPAATACTVTPIADVGLTRMPRNSTEGHLPKFAIATGGADPFECLLRKIGISDSEFTLPTGAGRVQYYKAYDGVDIDSTSATPSAATLWTNQANLLPYDVVLLPCEGTPDDTVKGVNEPKVTARQNVGRYVDLGGRLFVTHYSYTWLEDGPGAYPSVATWEHNESDRSDAVTLNAQIDDSFPKGAAFRDWLKNTNASSVVGLLPIQEWRHDVQKENNPPSQRWMYADTKTAYPTPSAASNANAGSTVQHITFNAPIDAGVDDAGQPLQFGKVVFSDFHVAKGGRIANQTFPAECVGGPMTPQEKALEFMLFDLTACIQKEDAPVTPSGTPPH